MVAPLAIILIESSEIVKITNWELNATNNNNNIFIQREILGLSYCFSIYFIFTRL